MQTINSFLLANWDGCDVADPAYPQGILATRTNRLSPKK
jgi:hypothetical protein